MTFSTPDLYYAAYAITCGHALVSTEGEPHKLAFVFDVTVDDVAALKRGWFMGGTIKAQAFASNVKLLKNLVHA